MPPYIHERQIEQWANTDIIIYLRQAGYFTTFFPPSQRLERRLPADVLFGIDEGDFIKMVGLQYKTLWSNGADHWTFETHQHRTLTRYTWIYYALSDLQDPRDAANVLHHLRFTRGRDISVPRTDARDIRHYERWGSFIQSVRECRSGVRVTGPEDMPPLLSLDPELAESSEVDNLTQVILLNETRRIATLISGDLIE